MLITQRHTFPFLIKLKNLDLNVIADSEQLTRVLKPAPRHVGNMQQPVYAAEVHKGAIVGQVLNLTFDHYVFLYLQQRLIFSTGVFLFDDSLAR